MHGEPLKKKMNGKNRFFLSAENKGFLWKINLILNHPLTTHTGCGGIRTG